MYQNYYFYVNFVLKSNKEMEPEDGCDLLFAGFENYEFKKRFYFNVPLNGNEIKNYIKWEIEEINITFMFNTKPVPFHVEVIIFRSNEYIEASRAEWLARYNELMDSLSAELEARHNLNPGSESGDDDDDDSTNVMKNKKQIINAEQTFKEDECVICLTNPPNILFCNCGHIAICIECNKTGESLGNCPVCKTENTIKRII